MIKRYLLILMCLFVYSCAPLQPKPTQSISLTAGLQEVSGIVLSGGDQTPQGLIDAPRTYIYQVRLDSGEEINISYIAYPPSPANESKPSPKLTFNEGEIKIGDYIKAKGLYDLGTQTLTVALETDFIETYAKKP